MGQKQDVRGGPDRIRIGLRSRQLAENHAYGNDEVGHVLRSQKRDTVMDRDVEVYLGLGTNLGERQRNLWEAIERLDEAFGCRYSAVSDFIETEPWGFYSQNRFLNAAVRYVLSVPAGISESDFSRGILKTCKSIEMAMGRSESPEYDAAGKRVYHSRIIDIDILLIGDWTVDEPDLKIPHPLMSERDFVMRPLSEILSDNTGTVKF